MGRISYLKIRGDKPHNPTVEALIHKINERSLASYQIMQERMNGRLNDEEVEVLKKLLEENGGSHLSRRGGFQDTI